MALESAQSLELHSVVLCTAVPDPSGMWTRHSELRNGEEGTEAQRDCGSDSKLHDGKGSKGAGASRSSGCSGCVMDRLGRRANSTDGYKGPSCPGHENLSCSFAS